MILRYVTSFILVLGLWVSTSRAQHVDADSRQLSALTSERVKVAVLPFVNNTASVRAIRVVSPILDKALLSHGFNILSSDSLRNVLRQYRIRTNGMINASDGKRVLEATGLAYLVVGSVDIFEENATPEIGISVRILDLESMRVIWTSTIGATGQDYAGLFGVGIIDSIDVLTRRAVADQLDGLSPERLKTNRTAESKRETCAVVPCEDYSSYPRAGDIMSSLLVSTLFNAGYDVIEPGVVNEIMITGRSQSRGGVDYGIMDLLKERYGVKLIFTGSVDVFRAVRGDFEQSSPEVSLGIRVLDPESHLILATYDKERTGAHSETVFRLGACNSLEKLTAGLLGDLLHTFTTQQGRPIADRN